MEKGFGPIGPGGNNTIHIYSNDGSELLDSFGDEKIGITIVEIIEGFSPHGVVILRGSDEHQESGTQAWLYPGDGYFRGLSYEANSGYPDIGSTDSDITIEPYTDLYVVDNEPLVKVYNFSYEESDEEGAIISIPQGEVGVLDCKEKYMEYNVAISNNLNDTCKVYLGAKQTEKELIIEIPRGQTAVLECENKLMPDDIYIRTGEPLEE